MINGTAGVKKYLKAEALSAVRSGDVDTGIAKYNEYLQLNPDDDDAWAGLGGAYRRKGDIDKALESYQKAYAANAQSSYALVNIVSLLAARNRPEDAQELTELLPLTIRLVQEIINRGESTYWTWYDLATLQLFKKDDEQAKSTFSYAVNLTPKTATENFRSVLNNLEFLKSHNPGISGIDAAIEILRPYADTS